MRMKKILPILALFLASSCSDVGRYQRIDLAHNNGFVYIMDTTTGVIYRQSGLGKDLYWKEVGPAVKD